MPLATSSDNRNSRMSPIIMHASPFGTRSYLFLFCVRKSIIPSCLGHHLDPEVATVGLTESQAKERGTDYELIEQEMKAVDRAVVERTDAGFARVLVKRGSDKILGATIVGEHAGELIQEFVLAMKHGIGLKQIASTIYAYPTFASLVLKSAEKFNKKRLTPRARKFTGWLYARERN